MKLGRVAIAGLAFAALAAVLSGCVVFQAPPTAKQIKKKPKVRVAFTICASFDPGSDCPRQGNSDDSSATGDWKVLLGFRVPKGTKTPNSFESTSVDAMGGTGGVLTLSRSESYTDELNDLAPRPNKYKYSGYTSQTFNLGDDAGFGSEASFEVKMKVPKRLVGKKFKVRPVSGAWQVSGSQSGDTIDCGSDLYDEPGAIGEYEDGTYGICIDDPSPSDFENIKVKIKPKKK